MVQRPLFSIVIPTLGKLDLWKQAIHSVLVQDLKDRLDFEIIAVDSGPREKSLPVIQSFNDSRVKYVNTLGGNPRLNWDAGFLNSQGKYIIWMDDDDYLLPFCLSTLAEGIQKTGADIVTADNIHWRNTTHKVNANQLAIPAELFSCKQEFYDPLDLVRHCFDLPTSKKIKTRFGWADSAIRRELVDLWRKRCGRIDWGYTSTHTLRVGLHALARTALCLNVPVAIKCYSGSSMSTNWPKDSADIHHAEFTYTFSPVRGNTYSNYIFENYLLAKNRFFKEELKDLPLDTGRFIREIYLHDLRYLDGSWRELWRHWKELYNLAPAFQLRVTKVLYGALGACLVKFMRDTKLIIALRKLFLLFRPSQDKAGGKIVVPLERYGATSIQECAEKLPEIIEKELGMSYGAFRCSDFKIS